MNQSLRNQRTGGFALPVRAFCGLRGMAGAIALAAAPLALVHASPAAAEVAVSASSDSLNQFYHARADRPLWLAPQSGNVAHQLLQLLQSAQADGLDPRRYSTDKIAKALQKAWGGSDRAAAKADRMLSEAFVAYANDMRRAPAPGMNFVDADLAPRALPAAVLLAQAASAPSLQDYVAHLGWMNPIYGKLREALASGRYSDPDQQRRLQINLSRARVLPASGRYIVVNPAQQRLYMYEGRDAVDSMRVVVGKLKWATPMFAAHLRYATLNPYWNVPPDLVPEDVAVYVLKYGVNYLKTRGYQVLSDWTDNATVVDPATIDWQAVMDGKTELRIRQLPGPRNVLGVVKYSMPNPFGIYLHDTSSPDLLNKETRLFSGGCIRLQDAQRLGAWLFGRQLKATSKDPDIQVPLDQPVPVFVTYLTAIPEDGSIAFLDDVYGRDGPAAHPEGTQVALR